ncbi:hypothetical protein LARI1_G009505 [Lachnellula arida]|uniref:Uncharacterized protein n=1 Tax=Lachnellula arida TaxID=1316785 RepID=A0A8T9AZX6_9HELO|nr:hypothetical protein LARI1_G009505 [Lachnellula arida]
MIVMEGMMMVPPERGTLIGRAVWKPRYVVFGTGAHLKTQTDTQAESTGKSSSGRRGLKSTSSKPSLVDVIPQAQESQEQTLYISIYKAKGDWEYLAQHPITSFKSCEIRNIQHRKQGPSLPTLMIEFKPDPTSEKQRKRRSSRTGGLTSSKDPWANILLFRTIQEERYNIYDWQAAVKPNLTPDAPDDSPLTPSSPSFSFTNPFSPRETKSQTGSTTGRTDYQRTASGQNNMNSYPHAQRSAMISPSPSLRSRRSDLSSQASSLHPPMGFTHSQIQNYNPTLPSDLPSPASTTGYDSQFIEGWTSAQGRSSALSSHTRGSNSIASAVAPTASIIGSTPPGPRETILDRAFQMRYIPGSDRAQDREEEKISSIARFEALMRESDERKKQRTKEESAGTKSKWDLDEEPEESDDELDEDDETKGLEMPSNDIEMPTPAQRALDYISGRRTPIQPSSRPISPAPRSPPIPFLNPQAMSAFHGPPHSSAGGLRPRAGTTSSRNNTSRPSSLALPPRSVSNITIPTLKEANSSGSNLKTSSSDKEKRRSSNSVKRLSFQEFAKRLSSTSSLLLVQTNASSSSGRDGSRRTSSEYGVDNEEKSDKDGHDKRCGWRGEGGFL